LPCAAPPLALRASFLPKSLDFMSGENEKKLASENERNLQLAFVDRCSTLTLFIKSVPAQLVL